MAEVKYGCVLLTMLGLLQAVGTVQGAGTRIGFYSLSCPNAESIVKSTVQSHVSADQTLAAGLLRMHFHDCFVQGCDGSVLIDSSSSEKTAFVNLGLRGFEVITDVKTKLEAACPGVVSCADIVALAARDSVVLSGGPSWSVPTGRRDGRVSSASDTQNLPSPLDSVAVLKQKFSAKGLSTVDLATLSGAHTIGQTECQFFNYRLYNFSSTGKPDPSMNANTLSKLQQLCPNGGDGSAKVPLDLGSQTSFDTSYFTNVRQGSGVLESDQKLFGDSSTQIYVRTFSGLITGLLGITFDISFINSMIKMSNIGVKTGSDGEIRKVCSAFN
ncbi:hypothetical protein O6H91_19G011500 [Diphasiastrum complanatum]|uniref:Uncharacterized protein n=1 Tax=Diphasiastrum complanatum TaxID=34168 RepID=A0ACC2ASX4_DIPCM|nr:hypothetical protein O6H91_19G011500 [Diphasiastrum complanatum]